MDVAVRQLLADTSVINKECKPIFYRGKNKQRFHDVVCSYMPEEAFEKFQDDFRETDLQTKDAQIDSRGLFRVIVLYLLDDKMNPKLLVVELDPYHLMFPVGDERDWQKRYVQYSSKRLDTGNSFHDVYESSFLKMEVWQHQDFETSLQ
ncbi:hypothetical protein [Levilactobacillus cerevisiae]|uniref:hypothetical protein n=1 Tax=Levilactobacillus cerevisiae TaxID=1704076 RepID=UPI000F78B633|nr:hypothetical protein [Levilactobacillus cerevisiae]